MISVTVRSDVATALRGLQPEAMQRAIAAGMTEGAQIVAGMVTEQRLTGKGPFPVEQHRLGVITGRLRQSLRAAPARIEGDRVIVSIGSPVGYAAAHEFGFDGTVTIKEHTRQAHLRRGVEVREHRVKSYSRHLVIPERAPVRTGIREHLGEFSTSIADAIKEEMNHGLA